MGSLALFWLGLVSEEHVQEVRDKEGARVGAVSLTQLLWVVLAAQLSLDHSDCYHPLPTQGSGY